jgi:hypothetical protein
VVGATVGTVRASAGVGAGVGKGVGEGVGLGVEDGVGDGVGDGVVTATGAGLGRRITNAAVIPLSTKTVLTATAITSGFLDLAGAAPGAAVLGTPNLSDSTLMCGALMEPSAAHAT